MPGTAERATVFLDRDGTINVDYGYVHQIEDLALIRGAAEAIASLNAADKLVVVVSNQSGVGRGLYAEDDVERLHRALDELLARAGAHIDAYYYCPDHPSAGLGRYRRDSSMRKPGIGMFEKACTHFDIDVAASWMVGDKLDDMRFGRAAGLKGLLVQTGKGAAALQSLDEPAWFDVVPSLAEAATHILERDG